MKSKRITKQAMKQAHREDIEKAVKSALSRLRAMSKFHMDNAMKHKTPERYLIDCLIDLENDIVVDEWVEWAFPDLCPDCKKIPSNDRRDD